MGARRRIMLMEIKKAWNPTRPISEKYPLVWLKADSLVASDNDPVAAWNSTYPATVNVAQSTEEKKPLYKTNVLNGLPGILFDNSNDNLQVALDLSAYDKFTIFAIVSNSDLANSHIVCELGTAANVNGAFLVAAETAGNAMSIHYKGDYSNYLTTDIVSTTPKLICFTHDISAATNEVTGWVNGVTGGTRPYNVDLTGNFGNLAFNVGSRNNGASVPLAGYIFEMLLYPGIVLSDADRIKVENYLNKKWALFNSGIGYTDNAYPAEVARSDSGTYIRTSPFARLVYETDAETAYLDTYNDIYDDYPDFTEIGVRVNGVDYGSYDIAALETVEQAIDLGVGAGKTVEFISGAQSKPGAAVLGTFVCGATFNKPAIRVYPSETPRLLIYGDSIAAGGNCTNPTLETWGVLVRDSFQNSTLIEAWGYRTLYSDGATAGARTTFAAHIAEQNPAVIWLAIGVNDYALDQWSAADFGDAYADLLDKLHSALPDAVIYAQTPIVRTVDTERTEGWGDLAAYRTAIGTAQSTRSAYCNLVDGTALMTSDDLDDGVHPTTAGHAIYAAAVKVILGI